MPGSAEEPTPWDPEEPVEKKWHPTDHGKPRTYNEGCRCDMCREANRVRMAKYRSGKGKGYVLEQKARGRAMRELAEKHPTEFNKILKRELRVLRREQAAG